MEKDMGKHQMQWTKTHAPCAPLIVPLIVVPSLFWGRARLNLRNTPPSAPPHGHGIL